MLSTSLFYVIFNPKTKGRHNTHFCHITLISDLVFKFLGGHSHTDRHGQMHRVIKLHVLAAHKPCALPAVLGRQQNSLFILGTP